MRRHSDWELRHKEIKEHFPLVNSREFDLSIDSEALARLMADLLKAEGKRPQPGKRPPLPRKQAETEYARLTGIDYSDLPFARTFSILAAGRSTRSLAAKTGLNKDYLNQFMRGLRTPSFREMEVIAKAFGKDPSFFSEYRLGLVLMMIDRYLKDSPDLTTAWYVSIKRKTLKVN